MRKVILSVFVVCFIMADQLASGQSNQKNTRVSPPKSALGSHLVPLLHDPMNDEIQVRNLGAGPSVPSKLTLDCETIGTFPAISACPDLPPSVADTYFDPAFPKHATVKVPALAPGQTFTHKLSFWNAMKWKGTYKFTAVVRLSDSPQDTITKDQVSVSFLTVH